MTSLPVPPINIFAIKSSLMHGRVVCENLIDSIKSFHEVYPMESNMNQIQQIEDLIGRADAAMEAIDPNYKAPTEFNRAVNGIIGERTTEMLNNFRDNLGDASTNTYGEDAAQSKGQKNTKETEKSA